MDAEQGIIAKAGDPVLSNGGFWLEHSAVYQRGPLFTLKILAPPDFLSVLPLTFSISKGKQRITVGDIRNYLINHSIVFS